MLCKAPAGSLQKILLHFPFRHSVNCPTNTDTEYTRVSYKINVTTQYQSRLFSHTEYHLSTRIVIKRQGLSNSTPKLFLLLTVFVDPVLHHPHVPSLFQLYPKASLLQLNFHYLKSHLYKKSLASALKTHLSTYRFTLTLSPPLCPKDPPVPQRPTSLW